MAERPEDLNLPNSIVMRLIKDSLPPGVLVSKEARSAIARAASVFVLYATSTANALAQANKKKTLTGQDVLDAIKEMDFEQFVEPLTECLEAFKRSQQSKKELKEAKAKAKKQERSPAKKGAPAEEQAAEEELGEDVVDVQE
ncbi:DNA polymerase epsilon subunit 3 [Hyalella azteca]|uniref:DNA polymerase epsilon subunit 3 n=1 Tax=Hyalella azteca TaxID=294128 RepID=A0A8B7PC07_HYAAZ|nr:DNA polymerase epsilon subunit 3 [Hyalella azteca]